MAHVASRGQLAGSRLLGQLPAEASSFVGRTTECAAITGLLGAARMVTVVGPAGVGKTRTSLRVASAVAGRYPDGAWYADLAGISDPGQLAGTVAAALGLRDVDDADGQTAVLARLRGKQLLLILDTCEHLVDACAAFADTVLRAVPGVTVLATSRQPLDAPGEHAFPLLPLPVEPDAAELFAQRAAAVVPGFTVTAKNRADVVRLCRRLDGIPLAIELAAVRLRALPLAELAVQLESGPRLLTVSRRGTSPRHQTLHAAVEWSYRLCNPAEQALWQRLSVFPETFDVSGAERVCAGGILPREQVLVGLVGLVDKSVVLRDAAEPARYRLPGAPREFGADRLAEADGQEAVLGRLTAWSLTLARDFDRRFRTGGRGGRAARATAARGGAARASAARGGRDGHDDAAALRRLHQEYPSIRAALSYALGPPRGPQEPAALVARRRLGADLAARLYCFWQLTGLHEEGRQWLGQVASLFPAPARERPWALGTRGYLAVFQGDADSAVADTSEAVRLAVAAGSGAEPAVARGYLQLNLALTFAGRHSEALAAGQAARLRLTASGHRAGLLSLEVQLALLHQLAGNTDEAIECCDRGLALLGRPELSRAGPGGPERSEPEHGESEHGESEVGVSGDAIAGPGPSGHGLPGRERWIGGYLSLISGLALARRPGCEEAAAQALRRGLAAQHELGDMLGTAYAVEALAWLAAQREQHERAAWLLGAADQLWGRTSQRLSGIALLEESRQRTVKATRAALGERRYTGALAHGWALGLDAVVRDAADADADGEAAAPGELADDAGGSAGPQGDARPQRDAAAVLTRREREIAELVASGLSNREIAGRLFISKRTVDAHVDHIFGKLELSSRVQLTVLLRQPARLTQAVETQAVEG
jgi:predicted ATPase/DNA-binding CsgD family transcriptional regulator/tetratricopeptide (TPR) repeat protein